jgi:hypothetical protein
MSISQQRGEILNDFSDSRKFYWKDEWLWGGIDNLSKMWNEIGII